MKVLEINKYPPSIFKQGRFLKEDWTSCSQVGAVGSGAPVSREEYLAVEDRYVRAVRRFMRVAGVEEPIAHGVEHWDMDNAVLRGVGLDDVLDGKPALQDGDVLELGRLDNVVRRCLRELAWLELVRPRSFLVHFGYDLRLIVALQADVDDAIAETQADGLFVYPGNTRIPTLDAWRGLGD